jgi:hypothetical protein
MSHPLTGFEQLKMLAGRPAQSLPAGASSTRLPSISIAVPLGDGGETRNPAGIVVVTMTAKLAPGARDPIVQMTRSRLTELTVTWSIRHSVLSSVHVSPAGSVSVIDTPFAVPVPAAPLLLTVIVNDA